MTGPVRVAVLAGLIALPAATGTLACARVEGARLYESGTEALDAGQTERAISDLERAAGLVPHASEIQNHLGIAYQAAGRDADALEAFERAVALDCDNAAAQTNLERLRMRYAGPARE